MHIFVVNVGQPAYAPYTFPFIEDYCRRHGYPLTVFEEPPPDGRPPQWQKLLAHEVVPDEHVLILDLDVAPQPYAPPIHALADRQRIGLVAERRREHRMGRLNALGFPANGVIHNAGVISSPAGDTALFAKVYQCWPGDRSGDQLFLNLQLAKRGIPVAPLDRRWNWTISGRFRPRCHAHLVWFVHFAGRADRRLNKSRQLWEYWYGESPGRRGHVRLLYERIRDLIGHPTQGAEVGVAEGQLSAALLGAFPKLTLHMIDSWATYSEEHPYHRSGDGRAHLSADQQQCAREAAVKRTAFAGRRAHIIPADSALAAERLGDNTLDFVFIDADHTYLGCLRDLEHYFPKVRSGGLFAGHDYGHRRHTGVRRAVDEFSGRRGLTLDVQEDVWSVRKP